jgi:hypothetical protein
MDSTLKRHDKDMANLLSNYDLVLKSNDSRMAQKLSNYDKLMQSRTSEVAEQAGSVRTNLIAFNKKAIAASEGALYLEQAQRIMDGRQYYDATISALDAGNSYLQVADQKGIADCVKLLRVSVKKLKQKELKNPDLVIKFKNLTIGCMSAGFNVMDNSNGVSSLMNLYFYVSASSISKGHVAFPKQ